MRSPQKPETIKEEEEKVEKGSKRKMRLLTTILTLDHLGALEDVYSEDQWVDNYYTFRHQQPHFAITVGDTFTMFID